jgi:ATP-binding cassette subfamily F protein 3
MEEMQAWSPNLGAQKLRSLLGIFQFSGDEVFKKVEVLSGGEKNRVALARLTLDPGNFLLLDEPTNHLDLPTREALEEALAGFSGTLLFVSHDRYFINKVATRVVSFQGGKLISTQGGYDDYLAAMRDAGSDSRASKASTAPRADRAATGTLQRGGKAAAPGHDRETGRTTVPTASSRPQAGASQPRMATQAESDSRSHAGREARRSEAETRNRRSRALRIHKERIAALEAKIVPSEARLKEIDAALASSDTYKETGLARSLGEEKKSLEIELAHLYDEWEESTSDLAREEKERA